MVQYATAYRLLSAPVKRRGFLQLAAGQSPDGYGQKISTDYLLQFDGYNQRKYRVYCVCFSNVASHYILKEGERLYLRDGEMQEARDSMR